MADKQKPVEPAEPVVTDVFLSLAAGRRPAEKLSINWEELRTQKMWLAGIAMGYPSSDPDEPDGNPADGLLNLLDGIMDAAVALGVPEADVFGPDFAKAEEEKEGE